ncbi:DUF6588 family protein [uncultured Polaribacter sp.]|uniref:DUF6588 family protein n=1 Tax=uncultured Polaribacter sp. TaxID=174711 RepID=UPI0030DC4299|tara:strand:+ start:7103 stop:8134 length:1032 start_codon:yes stop_codon:yes gene_type:complete
MKKYILIFIGVFTIAFHCAAQDNFENILLADKSDSQKLLQAYFAPGMEGLINGMNNGWYHTAKVHKTLGFDFSFGANLATVPTEKELFTIAALGLSQNISSTSSTASTFVGPDQTTNFTVKTTIDGNNVSADFSTPGGITGDLPMSAIPAPILQFSLGLPGDIEVMARFIPTIGFGEDDGEANMFGVGLKKEITSWFGPIDKLPLHVSLLAAYTKMDVSYNINVDNANLTVTNGLTKFDLSAFTVQAIGSLNFPIINVYGGFGYSSGSSNLKISGQYVGKFTDDTTQQTRTKTLEIPSDFNFESKGLRTTAGLRLSLGFLKIFGAYTLQEYNTFTLGAAISIR